MRRILVTLLVLLALAAPARAAVTATPVFPQTPKLALVQITNASGTTLQTLYTGGSNGSICIGISATSTDTAAEILKLAVTRSSTDYVLNTVTIPAGYGTSGTAGQPPVALTSVTNWSSLPVNSDGNFYIYLTGTGDVLKVGTAATITSGKVINVYALCSDF